MSNGKKNESSAFLLAEEAVQLLIQGGLVPTSVYVIGSVPFVLALIAYAGTMTHSGFAYVYHGTGALGLALLFLWMKAFQARFAQHLRARLHDEAVVPWTLGGFFTTLCRQGFIHASVVVVYPAAFVTLLPMGFAAAFYQNASVLDDGSAMSVRDLSRQALAQARLWPRQNHLLLWLCSPLMVCLGAVIYLGAFPVLDSLEGEFLVSLGGIYATIFFISILPLAPFAVITVVNVGSAIFFVIEMFHIFTGADTIYARSPGALLQNDLFIAAACGITYLLLDPVLKAAYAIRCHEGASLKTGADLRVMLRRIRQATAGILILATAALAMPCEAAAPLPADTEAAPLDQAIEHELAERRYTWRIPRETRSDTVLPWPLQLITDFGESVKSWIKATYEFVSDTVKAIWDWFFGESHHTSGAGASRNFNPSIRILIGILVVVLLGITLYLLWRAYQEKRPKPLTPAVAQADKAPDLADETTTAADLPEDEWYALARELAEKGEFRLASRALFFSILATLAQREIIKIARFKSNMDYDHELMRRAASIGDTPRLFSRSAFLYEAVWYGEHEATPQILQALQTCQQELRHGLQ